MLKSCAPSYSAENQESTILNQVAALILLVNLFLPEHKELGLTCQPEEVEWVS